MSQWWIDQTCSLESHNPSEQDLEQLRAEGFSVVVPFLQDAEPRPRYGISDIAIRNQVRTVIIAESTTQPVFLSPVAVKFEQGRSLEP